MLPGRGRSPERGALGAGAEKSSRELALATAPPGGMEEHVSCSSLGWTAMVKPRFLQQKLSGLMISWRYRNAEDRVQLLGHLVEMSQ